VVGRVGSAMFHSWIVLSPLPVARVRPSGLKATEETPSCPIRGWTGGMGWAGSVTFHNSSSPSMLPKASVRPSGLNVTDVTTAPSLSLLGIGGPVISKVTTWFDSVLASASNLGPTGGLR